MSRPGTAGPVQVWLPAETRARLEMVIHRLRIEAGPGGAVTTSGTLAEVIVGWIEREEQRLGVGPGDVAPAAERKP